MKLRFTLINEFLDANGYDLVSFCGFMGIRPERYKEIEAGADDVTTEELIAFCECVGAHPGVLIDKEE